MVSAGCRLCVISTITLMVHAILLPKECNGFKGLGGRLGHPGVVIPLLCNAVLFFLILN